VRYGLGGWTLGQLVVGGIYLSSQLCALGIAVNGVEGYPLQAIIGRALGKLAGGGFMIVLVSPLPNPSLRVIHCPF